MKASEMESFEKGQAHFSALETKHAGLESRIAQEGRRPRPDTDLIARLKKQKLRLKEQLVQRG